MPLVNVFGSKRRFAYMKTTIRSDMAQKVLFGAGSDDGIHVWLNGEMIHSCDTLRALKPDEDQFTGSLKAGENLILCKIKQLTQGWGGCLSIRSPNGGPALGVSVVPQQSHL